jgi:hypothetical protein
MSLPKRAIMPFDLDLLKPGRDIARTQQSVVEEIGLTFLTMAPEHPFTRRNSTFKASGHD